MGSIRKIGNEYVIEFLARGLKYQQKAGSDYTKAEALLKSIEDKITNGEMALMVRDVDVDIFIEDFLEFARNTYPAKTFARYQSTARHFFSYLQAVFPLCNKLSQITPRIIEQYRVFLISLKTTKGNPFSAKIVNLTLFLLRHIFEYSIKLGYLNDNPCLHVRFLKVSYTRRYRSLTKEDLVALLGRATIEISYILDVLLGTGISSEELVNLEWRDIDWGHHVIMIRRRAGMTRNVVERTIPLQQNVFDIFKDLRSKPSRVQYVFTDESGEKIDAKKVLGEFNHLIKESGIAASVKFSSLRHTFTETLVKKNVPLTLIQRILGHTDIVRTIVYTSMGEQENTPLKGGDN